MRLELGLLLTASHLVLRVDFLSVVCQRHGLWPCRLLKLLRLLLDVDLLSLVKRSRISVVSSSFGVLTPLVFYPD